MNLFRWPIGALLAPSPLTLKFYVQTPNPSFHLPDCTDLGRTRFYLTPLRCLCWSCVKSILNCMISFTKCTFECSPLASLFPQLPLSISARTRDSTLQYFTSSVTEVLNVTQKTEYYEIWLLCGPSRCMGGGNWTRGFLVNDACGAY